MLAFRLLWRDWRGGESGILIASLIIAVCTVTGISLFTERLQQAIMAQSRYFLAADRVLQTPREIDSHWLDYARQQGLRQGLVIRFQSMVFAGDAMHLSSVKAVSDSYPLLGQLEISEQPFAGAYKTTQGPPAGEAWLDSRLLALLNIAVGDAIMVGEATLKVTRIVINEPDRSGSFYLTGPRVLMNTADIPATQIIQPGSRVQYRYLFAGDQQRIKALSDWLKPRLLPSHKWLGLNDSQPRVSQALERARLFLLLAGALGVGLAGTAIALAARRYSERHYDYVAIMKSLGATSQKILSLYCQSLLLLALIATVIGFIIGWALQAGFIVLLRDYIDIAAVAGISLQPFIVGAATAFVCLLAFAFPALLSLRNVSALQVLRREFDRSGINSLLHGCLGIAGIALLILWYSGDLVLTLAVLSGIGVIFVVVGSVAWYLLRTSRLVGMQAGNVFHLTMASMRRRGFQNAVQVVIFSLAIMLLLLLGLVRTSLIDEWQHQLPEGTPNHFLVNIAEHEVTHVADLIAGHQLKSEPLYPIVRGRLTHINDKPVNTHVSKEEQRANASIDRELSLTWTDDVPTGNRLLQGQWWPEQSTQAQVSVESQLAERLGITLGDQLQFQIGSERLSVTVSSLRELDWDTMRPNFYMVFPPSVLNNFPVTYLTSFYLPPQKKTVLNQFVRQFPTVTVIEMDAVIKQIRSIINQISSAIELVLGLIIASGLLVLLASVQASLDSRYQESAILRALGARRRLVLGSLVLEFSMLGLLAGGLGALTAELAAMGLQTWVLDMDYSFHPWIWITGPVMGVVLIAGAGYLTCAKVVNRPPIDVLRTL